MACGVPTISSNASSLPEVAGDAALLVDPLNVNALAEAMTCVLENTDLNAGMISRGLVQAAQFTWERAARQLLKAFEGLL
jgi:glycosyltransferase involved in cell wall biosynthesis